MMNPLQFHVYKGMRGTMGAAQFNFQYPHYYKEGTRFKDFTGEEAFEFVDNRRRLKNGWKEREGAIFLEITSTKGPNIYDWDNKIVIALSVDDMGKLLKTLITGEECSIMHDPGAKTSSAGSVKKYLNVSSPKGTSEGCLINARQTIGSENKSHLVPLSGSDLLILRCLLTVAIPKALNW